MKIWLAILIVFSSLASADPKRLVMIGDSLTEGFGVKREAAYPALLQEKIKNKDWLVVNSSVGGSTAASAPSRVDWALKQKPQMILLALGANDGLRGTKPQSVEENLGKAIEKAKAAQVEVILAGIKLPPNYGEAYIKDFESVFPRLAKKYRVPLIPFLLENVGGVKDLNQTDGIHPNEKGHKVIADTVYKALEKYL